jgi:hypothetical protein
MLSPADVNRWIEAGCPEAVVSRALTCPYQVRGRLLTGDEAVICILADGCCPFQAVQPTTGDRYTELCTGQETEQLPFGAVPRYLMTDVVTIRPQLPVSELVRHIINTRADYLIVLDEFDRPIGMVSAKDVLNAVGRELTDEPE